MRCVEEQLRDELHIQAACVWKQTELSDVEHEAVLWSCAACLCVPMCLCKLSAFLSGWRKEQPAPSAYRPSGREAQASGHLSSTVRNVGSSAYRPNDLLHRPLFPSEKSLN